MEKLSDISTTKKSSALQWAYSLLDRRDYSEKALYDKLTERYSEQEAADAVRVCVNKGFVNDRRYGEMLCQRYSERFGKRRVYTELCRKGLDKELVKELIEVSEDENAPERNDEKLVRLISKKFAGALLTRETRQKAAAFLARRGYTGEDITRILQSYRENVNNEEETEAEE